MAGHLEISEICQKEENDKNDIQNHIDDVSNKITYNQEVERAGGEEIEEDIPQNNYSNDVKRYLRFDLLSLRNGKLSLHYPQCALRPELQTLSIWTCRLRCELHYLGLWKMPKNGNLYGNCNCNGSCQSYQCTDGGSGQSYSSSSSNQVNTNTASAAASTQICYGNVQQQSIHHHHHHHHQQQQLQPLQATSSSPTLGSKRAVRSRERSLNYQRCINTELIRATSPGSAGGSVESSSLQQHHMNHQATKSSFIDHRSISSSHLMPAFAKRRMVHANTLHNQSDAASSNFSNNNNTDHLSNNDNEGTNENSTHYDTSIKARKDSAKTANNQNDYHIYKSSPNNRADKNNDHLAENQAGWMNLVKKINSDYTLPNNSSKTSIQAGTSGSSGNKKLIYERRIGSGRLVPREVNWDMRSAGNKDKENSNNNGEKEKECSIAEADKLNNRSNTIAGRYSETRGQQERRIFEKRLPNSDDTNNSGIKRYASTTPGLGGGEDRSSYDGSSGYHLLSQAQQHFTGQRSMSFRRREYVGDHKDHHKEFRDFRDSKDSREIHREHRDQRAGGFGGGGGGDHQHHHHNHHHHHRDTKEEPEWFSEGPTSQHDTIELRGFEETDESGQYTKIERKTSESSLVSHNSSSNANLSTKESFDISNEITNNSNQTNDKDKDESASNSCNSNVKDTESTSNHDITNETNELPTDTPQPQRQQIIMTKPEDFENPNKHHASVTELFFDNFLNIEALENSLIGGSNDQALPSTNDGVGSSRFSRWFFNNSNSNLNSHEQELNKNPPTKDETKRCNKDLNESDFNSFMSFLKCNNFPTPELPKGLPSNVSALSVEELEARMRKMDTGDMEKSKCITESVVQNVHKNDVNQPNNKVSDCESEVNAVAGTDASHAAEINTQDVEAFRKLLDQLGKPRVDISMNMVLPNTPGQAQILNNPIGGIFPPSVMSPIPQSNALPPQAPPSAAAQSNMAKQEFMMKFMHQQHLIHHQQQHQQNMGKIIPNPPPSLLQHHHPHHSHHHHPHHHRITQMSPQHQQQPESIPLMSVPHHPHMPMIIGHPQKRLDVQHLIQSVLREELSRSFLEKELKNPNIHPYTKEIISTVLKETSRFNPSSTTAGGSQNLNDSIETQSTPNDINATPSNLMQSLARGEVSLNLLEHELNKLNNMGINVNEPSTNNGTFKERSRCGTPLTAPLNVASIPTSGGVIVPLPPQVVPAQKQNSHLTNENVCTIPSDPHQQQHAIASMIRPHHHEDSTLHLPTQRELQMHTQAIMQNALFKKKLEVEQHEALRRRQEIHKQQHELESSSINQQQQQSLSANSIMSQQQQTTRHINSPTPLAFTPTSVLRKMTAEKDTISNSSAQATTISSSSPQQQQQQQQQIQTHLQQPHLKIPTHQQIHSQQMSSYQHSNQPRMILGGGNFQYMHQQQPQQHQHQIPPAVVNGSPQISPQQKSQIRNQPPGPLKWPLTLTHSSLDGNHHTILNNMNNKPMGRPILKGPGPLQPLVVPQNTHNPLGQNSSNSNQNSQSLQTAVSQLQKYSTSMQQPRQIVGQQFSSHLMPQHHIPTSQQQQQQNNMQQQLFQQHQQQRPVVIQRQQIQQNDLGNHPNLPPPAHHPACNDNNSVTNLNYQRDGGLSPTSNQLAQWFSPELLAQASAGKLPLLNMNQALSLEEFERSIQHSSSSSSSTAAAVNN